MYKFGSKSLEQLITCHHDIQVILNELIKFYDFSVLEGIRTDERQYALFREGRSTLDGVSTKSKHQDKGNGISYAVDIMPWKQSTNAFSGHEKDLRRFYHMMGMVKAIASRLLEEGEITHKVRFGIDWDGDDTFRDQSFDDAPHFEIFL